MRIGMRMAPRLPPHAFVCPRRVCPQEVLDGLFGPAALPRPVRIPVIRTVEANVGTCALLRGPQANVRVELPADAYGDQCHLCRRVSPWHLQEIQRGRLHADRGAVHKRPRLLPLCGLQ